MSDNSNRSYSNQSNPKYHIHETMQFYSIFKLQTVNSNKSSPVATQTRSIKCGNGSYTKHRRHRVRTAAIDRSTFYPFSTIPMLSQNSKHSQYSPTNLNQNATHIHKKCVPNVHLAPTSSGDRSKSTQLNYHVHSHLTNHQTKDVGPPSIGPPLMTVSAVAPRNLTSPSTTTPTPLPSTAISTSRPLAEQASPRNTQPVQPTYGI